jgi:catechol 2,3-dioxygenase-like lactoylglutathione lyase family enzyme
MSLAVTALDHLVINVRDVEASAAWYQRVLGMARRDFDPGDGKAKRVSVVFGEQKINLRPLSVDKVEWFTADHDAAGTQDLCFLTSATPDQVVSHLKACGVAVELGPVAKQGARGILASVYCRDPDGSLIEISSYSEPRNSETRSLETRPT